MMLFGRQSAWLEHFLERLLERPPQPPVVIDGLILLYLRKGRDDHPPTAPAHPPPCRHQPPPLRPPSPSPTRREPTRWGRRRRRAARGRRRCLRRM
mmetsp:Transcript_37358/g.103109  ORF Transcript_37358/g.103109 Transcript_37358/m.103109 type:complete len:96 (+) Transcript_37358:156-443(+)